MSCRSVAVGLQHPLVPITAIRVVGPRSGLYRALRQYKSGEPEVAQRQQRRLAAILDAFGAHHLAAIAPGGLDATVVVPSTGGGRPRPHPLAEVVTSAGHLPPLLDGLTSAGGVVDHRKPSTTAYRAGPEVAGLRLLLLDDVYTSGAHLQSAARALLDVPAARVVALVIGRYERRGTTG